VEEVPVSSIDPGFYSRLFIVPKKTGGMRPVIDLSILNTYLVVPHFKMETNRSIRASILPGMWTTSLDLSDAYFHIPICHSYRRYIRFVWDNRVYQFRALPFGIASGLGSDSNVRGGNFLGRRVGPLATSKTARFKPSD
jgi:hypothetical protein